MWSDPPTCQRDDAHTIQATDRRLFWGRGPKTGGGALFRTCSGGAGAKPPVINKLEDTERFHRSVF